MNTNRKLNKVMVIICFLCIGSWPFWAQENKDEPYDPNKSFSAQELEEDFKILRDALEEGHAGLYRYTSKERFDEHFDSLQISLIKASPKLNF